MAHIKWEFLTNGRGQLRLKFFEYSASREYTIQPDIVEYDTNHMSNQGLISFLDAIP